MRSCGVFLVGTVGAWSLGACQPVSLATSCEADAHCPPGYRCQLQIGFCAPVDRIDQPIFWPDGGRVDAVGVADATHPSGLFLATVRADLQQVSPGTQGVGVEVMLQNRGVQALTVLEVGLGFTADGADLRVDYVVHALTALPLEIDPGAVARVQLEVDVLEGARSALVQVDAGVRFRAGAGDAVEVSGAAETAAWVVAARQVLVVSTADDEDDCGDAPSLQSAGGPADLSLREALRIAASSAEPRTVRFSPDVFPAGTGRTITLDAALGGLPAITVDQTAVDAQGAEVVISGRELAAATGLQVNAHGVVLRGLTVREFRGAGSACLRAEGVDSLQLVGCDFSNNGTGAGTNDALVHVSDGQDLQISGCRFSGSSTKGLYLHGSPVRPSIVGSTFSDNDGLGLTLQGVDVNVEACDFTAHYAQAVRVSDTTGGALVDCTFIGNHVDSHLNSRQDLIVADSVYDLLIDGCGFLDSSSGVSIASGASQVSVRQGRFYRSVTEALFLAAGANDGVQPPSEVRVEGTQVRGLAAGPGEVELYVKDSGLWRYVAVVPVVDGEWIATPAIPGQAVATYTTALGSTSTFSQLAAPDPRLVVTTADDELDGGEAVSGVLQAGGPGDLSLREALHIASNMQRAHILFDPAVFPEASPARIEVGAGSAGRGALPAITSAGTTIDGRGAGVVLSGGDRAFAAGTGLLTVAADEVSIQGLRLERYQAEGGALIMIANGSGVSIASCEMQCFNGTISGVHLEATSPVFSVAASSVAHSRIVGCGNAVLSLHVAGLSVVDSELASSAGSCAVVDYGAASFEDCDVHHCGQHGLFVDGSATVQLVGSTIWSTAGTAVYLQTTGGGGVTTVNARHVTLVSSAAAVNGGAQTQISLDNSIVTGMRDFGVRAVGRFSESHNLFFDNGGDGDTGANAVEGWAAAELDPSDVLADPELRDPGNGDFTPGPAAVDHGVDLGYDRNGDLPGDYNGEAPDIGAIETGG